MLILCTSSSLLYGQQVLSSFANSTADKQLDVKIEARNSKKYKLFIEGITIDDTYKDCGILIGRRKWHEKFIKSINTAKSKYIEWVKTAKENDVKDLRKKMSLVTRQGGYFYTGNERHNVYIADYIFIFSVSEVGEKITYNLSVGTGKMKSSKNQFITSDGVMLVFSSEAEIDNFLEAISLEKTDKYLAEPNQKELFKD